jgi:hypothetical protein
MAKSEEMNGNATYTNATFEDGSSLMDYGVRWGNDEDVVEGIFCSECGIVFPPHTWLQAKTFDIVIYGNCDCT